MVGRGRSGRGQGCATHPGGRRRGAAEARPGRGPPHLPGAPGDGFGAGAGRVPDVFFAVSTDGYSIPADAFGNEQVTVVVSSGQRHVLQMTRTQKAERLFRLTGFGVYFDSVLLGEVTPSKQPLLNADVLGQDSILAVPYNGKIHW